jgi:aminoglycoside/choline kinase family phosphotransferase
MTTSPTDETDQEMEGMRERVARAILDKSGDCDSGPISWDDAYAMADAALAVMRQSEQRIAAHWHKLRDEALERAAKAEGELEQLTSAIHARDALRECRP